MKFSRARIALAILAAGHVVTLLTTNLTHRLLHPLLGSGGESILRKCLGVIRNRYRKLTQFTQMLFIALTPSTNEIMQAQL